MTENVPELHETTSSKLFVSNLLMYYILLRKHSLNQSHVKELGRHNKIKYEYQNKFFNQET